jgi:RNA polymerase sigma factor (sigma-70 family)
MSEASVDTVQLQAWVQRIRAGDLTARDELLWAVCRRLERLARTMLQKYPSVRRYEETGDLFQNAVLRLIRALQDVNPTSTRDFFGLAAEQMRRELLDLVKRYYGPRGAGTNVADGPMTADPPDPADDPADLEAWEAFHTGVERLPAEEREVVGLTFYHGWSQPQIAELLGVDERTVRRWWTAAQARLRQLLADGHDLTM